MTIASSPVTISGGVVAGTVELRFSPRCQAGWSRFTPTANLPDRPTILVTTITRRLIDHAQSPYTVSYTGVTVVGNLMLVARGCIDAQVVVVEHGSQLSSATTPCETGLS